MSTTISRNPLWDDLAEEADRAPAKRPDLRSQLHSKPPTDIRATLAGAWLSGFIPLILLYLCFAQGYLVAGAPLVALALLPLASGRHGTTPFRLLGLGGVVMLVPVLVLYELAPIRDWDPSSPIRNKYAVIMYNHIWTGLGVLALLCVATYFIRERCPWYESRRYPNWATLLIGALVFFPLFVFFLTFYKGSETKEVRQWESQVLNKDPHLYNKRLIHFDRPSDLEDLEWTTRELRDSWASGVEPSSLQQANIRAWEALALKSLEGPNRLSRDGDTTSHELYYLDELLTQHAYLKKPLHLLAATEKLRMAVGEPSSNEDALRVYCEESLQRSEVTVLKDELSVLNELIETCPDPVRQYDRGIFARRPVYLLGAQHLPPAFLNLSLFEQTRKGVARIKSWLSVRPDVVRGEFDVDSRHPDIRGYLSMHEHSVKPLWEVYSLLYQLKIQKLETGAYPADLSGIEIARSQSGRWDWRRDEKGGNLRDLKLGPAGEWKLQ